MDSYALTRQRNRNLSSGRQVRDSDMDVVTRFQQRFYERPTKLN